MSPDEMVLDPWSFATDAREQPLASERAAARAAAEPSPLGDGTCRPCARSCSTARPRRCAPCPSARPSQARLGAGPERLTLRDVSISYARQRGRQVGLAVDPPGRGAGADRAVRAAARRRCCARSTASPS